MNLHKMMNATNDMADIITFSAKALQEIKAVAGDNATKELCNIKLEELFRRAEEIKIKMNDAVNS